MIRKLLIANRGEIAVRVARTARAMGIATVAIYSDADADMPHVRACDEAVRIGPPEAAQSYLDVERVIRAAQLSGADALHPGYGFLSERAALPEACAQAGIVFVGPSPAAMAAVGLKREARKLAAAAGVPVVPGYDGAEQSLEDLHRHARGVGYPLLVKASAGGGGKGMRVVHAEPELRGALESARREAEAAFGDGTLLIERYVGRARHVEIQILGDQHGDVVHLGERECSIQRRHQKLVEESPSPALTPALRARMGAAAVALARSIGYSNAGTVEFVLGPGGEFFFLEVNTRLQVEHPVTECVTGLDLVREQLRIARGERLGFSQEQIVQRGAAIECRLYAEDPTRGNLPATGTILDWHVPAGVRADAGVERGSRVGIHYDSLLAKLVTHGEDRAEALQKMALGLRELSVLGVTTNRALLHAVVTHPLFLEGRYDTHFLADHLPPSAPAEDREAALAATLAAHERRSRARTVLPAVASGWRNNPYADQTVAYAGGPRVAYRHLGEGRFHMRAGDWSGDVRLLASDPPELSWEHADGRRKRARVVAEGERHHVHVDGRTSTLLEEPRFPEVLDAAAAGRCTAPMPGKVLAVKMSAGDTVVTGQVLVVLEAMKMEHSVRAPEAGTVAEVLVRAGQQVADGAVLVRIEKKAL